MNVYPVQRVSEVIASWSSTHAANRRHPKQMAIQIYLYSLFLKHIHSKFSRVLALTIKTSLIHNNMQMLWKPRIGCLKVTCHFTNAVQIVNCFHKVLFTVIISGPGNGLLQIVWCFGYYTMPQCIWTYHQIYTRVKFSLFTEVILMCSIGADRINNWTWHFFLMSSATGTFLYSDN